ncbi:hypothetical protein D9M68_628010 [compost metagenome]
MLLWLLLGALVGLVFHSRHMVADVKDEVRAAVIARETRRGRRSLQVLAASAHTALREPYAADGRAQMDALQGSESALKAQRSWRSDADIVRHSRLPLLPDESTDAVLVRVFGQLLVELAGALAEIPKGTPLVVLFDAKGSELDEKSRELWQRAWSASGIDLPTRWAEKSGLEAVDHWLDRQIDDPALLLVIAAQVTPRLVEGSAEAVVGLLLGNHLTQKHLQPMACLHRPEQERKASTDALTYAVRQALDWVPLPTADVMQVWFSGIGRGRQAALATALARLEIAVKPGQGAHDLDASLGHAGSAAPWLAIAAAANAAHRNRTHQLIVCGERSEFPLPLWSVVVAPAASL